MTLQPICEFLDVTTDRSVLRLAVRLRFQDRAEGERFVLRLTDRRGRVLAQASAEVTMRVNTVGEWARSELLFDIPVDDVPDGAFRLELAAATEEGAGPGDPALVEPSTGLLAASRPTAVGRERQVQAVPAAGRPAVWLRLGSTTPAGRARWLATEWLRELAFVVRARRFTWVRAARLATRPFVPRGPVWLVGERPETARDNGRALFEHLRTTRPDAPVYYVITGDSPMRSVVEPLGNVVVHSSWRHRVLMLHAQVLANAYSIKHMLPSRWHPGAYMRQAAWRTGAYRVYLKHGVHLSPYAVKRANGGYDLVAAVGEREAEALRATSGYGDEVVVTGLARYDSLVRPATRSRTILFMPTWRRYLVPTLFSGTDESQVPYEGSTYQRFVDGLLGSDRLAELLARHDLTLLVVPHYNLRSLLTADHVSSERVRVLDASTADIPALLRSCDLLVTDYSSVQFDVAYVGTPVVYCHFDAEEYISGHSAFSWFQVDRDGFGPVVTDVRSTLDEIERYAEADFAREPLYEERVRSVFAWHDRHNAERLTAAIDELVGGGRRTALSRTTASSRPPSG